MRIIPIVLSLTSLVVTKSNQQLYSQRGT